MPELDTTELRQHSENAPLSDPISYSRLVNWIDLEIPLLRRAADTIDALRAELHGQMTSTETERSYAHVVETLRRVTNERAALHRIIAGAPHAPYCPQYDGYSEGPCRCFKSRIEETR